MNTVFALFEIFLTNMRPAPWTHVVFLEVFLVCYLGGRVHHQGHRGVLQCVLSSARCLRYICASRFCSAPPAPALLYDIFGHALSSPFFPFPCSYATSSSSILFTSSCLFCPSTPADHRPTRPLAYSFLDANTEHGLLAAYIAASAARSSSRS
ncbi:hypothetical protein FIBSPDRAFT_604055 [Athelia psychrophila]|uniref:Uncharacterized protein n=1 Tax=Athelia psychrophila TaxID=1759441 RepID=A0A166GRJ1_9AGAM|nr:hypothetical protein FIBSPDRAFT_604055 [Fibularhizoctonia sp. CBS 109695]